MAGPGVHRGAEKTRVPDGLERGVGLWLRKRDESRMMGRFSAWATGWELLVSRCVHQGAGDVLLTWAALVLGEGRAQVEEDITLHAASAGSSLSVPCWELPPLPHWHLCPQAGSIHPPRLLSRSRWLSWLAWEASSE